MDYRERTNLLGTLNSLMGGSGGGLLSAFSSLGGAGAGGAGGLLSLLGGMAGGSGGGGGNPLELLKTISSLSSAMNLGGNQNNPANANSQNPFGFTPPQPGPVPGNPDPMDTIHSLLQSMNIIPPNIPRYNPPNMSAGANPLGGQNPMAGIDTDALLKRMNSLMGQLNNATPPPAPPHSPIEPEMPIIDAETGQVESEQAAKDNFYQQAETASASSAGINPDSLNAIFGMLSSMMANNGNSNTSSKHMNDTKGAPQDWQNQDAAASANPQDAYGQPPWQAYANYSQPNHNHSPDHAETPRFEEEPYSHCYGCNNPWCRHQEDLPSFAEVRRMARNWQRY